MDRLNGKVAIITGGNSGVGAATAIKFAAEGAKVVITARREAPLLEVAEKIRAAGGEVLPVVSDISKAEDAKKVLDATLAAFGKVDILINNAGIYPPSDFLTSRSEDWKKLIDINILGTMYAAHAVLPAMIENGYGRIVNIGSVAGHYGLSWFVEYSMTKGAIISFTRALAKAVTPKGVTVNCVSPGTIDVNGVKKNSDFSFVGREGTTTSVLRPTGIADFDGVRMNVSSEGSFVQAGVKIRIISVEGQKILVRPV
jgi:NAD(P)-dependent dehydrogenase (short-subunit alcohol dehydrogenase family)